MPAKKSATKATKKKTQKTKKSQKTSNAADRKAASRRKPTAKAAKPVACRRTDIPEDKLSPAQRALTSAIRSGPRGNTTQMRGPFAVFLQAPEYGHLAQQLGGFVRHQTAVPPRLSEFAILVAARHWRAQYEWFAHRASIIQSMQTAASHQNWT